MSILISKYDALGELGRLFDAMPSALDDAALAWRKRATITLGTIFGDDSAPVKELSRIAWHGSINRSEPEHESRRRQEEAYRRGAEQAKELLKSLIRRIQLIPDPPHAVSEPLVENAPKQKRRIFIVHGHNNALRNGVARYIECLGLEPVILFERPNKGRTVIEKFEEESDTDYAVVLATGDDLAASVKDLKAVSPNETSERLALRTRQNVVFELGYFVGRHGRGAVMLVADPELEIPSDLAGIVYTTKEEIRIQLWKELEAAGFKFTQEQIAAATSVGM